MRFPEVLDILILSLSAVVTVVLGQCGTVTYLTETGGPTLIFNQTTPDGNRDVPVQIAPFL